MSGEGKSGERAFDFPMMPIYGLELGERLGEFSADQKHIRNDIQLIRSDIQRLDARIDALDVKTDKMAYALNRLDERTKSLESKFSLSIGLTGAVLAAVIAGIILQYFK